MMRAVGVGLVTSLLSVCATVAVLSWRIGEDTTDVFEDPASLTFQVDGIEKVELDTASQTIGLNVFISKPLNCKQVIDKLGIMPLPVGEKVYSPDCRTVNSSLIKITYIETISV